MSITANLETRLTEEYEKLKRQVSKPNIMLIGATGVGKSSLVNLVFGRDIAKAGTGLSVTKNINRYSDPETGVVLLDTRGYEAGSQEQELFLSEVVDYAAHCQGEAPEDLVHVVWYCIQASGHRILDIDISTIKRLAALGIPVAVILTKCDVVTQAEVNALLEVLDTNLSFAPVFLTTTIENSGLGPLDAPKLIGWSLEKLPGGLRTAFISAQKLNLAAKREEAKAVIVQHLAGAFAVGFTPIPVSDAPILVLNQMALVGRILYLYDMETMLKSVEGLLKTLGAGKAVSALGLWTVGQIMKFLPGVGTVVGGLINGTVASAVTGAIGQAISIMCYRINLFTLRKEEEKLKDFLDNLEFNFQNLLQECYRNQDQAEEAYEVK